MITNAEINEKLASLSESAYKEFNKKLIPTLFPILGVRAPAVKELSKLIAKDPGDYFDTAELNNYEQILLYGLSLAAARLSIDKTFYYLDKLIPLFDNWAHVDSIIASFKQFNKSRPLVLEHFMPLKDSPHEFSQRVFVIVLMDYFMTPEYIENTLRLLTQVPAGKYYTDMAVAWALSVALIKFYDKTLPLLISGAISGFVHNKTISKACDSFRITDMQKARLKTLRRRQA